MKVLNIKILSLVVALSVLLVPSVALAQAQSGDAVNSSSIFSTPKGYFQNTGAQQQTSNVSEASNAKLLQDQKQQSITVTGGASANSNVDDSLKSNGSSLVFWMIFLLFVALISLLGLLLIVFKNKTKPEIKEVKVVEKEEMVTKKEEIEEKEQAKEEKIEQAPTPPPQKKKKAKKKKKKRKRK